MRFEPIVRNRGARRTAAFAWPLLLGAALISTAAEAAAQGPRLLGTPVDPRTRLAAGWTDAGQAARGLELLANRPRPEGFFNPQNRGDFSFANTDVAFRGDLAFVGSYNGFQVWDVSDPANPTLRSTLVCPGGQGDVSVHGNLLFVSVEENRGRVDCGGQGVSGPASAERFRGVRIFDISNLDAPRQVAAVQTCRGSHTHTLVTDPDDAANLYLYVSGTAPVRSGEELEGCSGLPPEEDPNTSLFRIEVVRVPLAAPQDARVVSAPRVFADPQSGSVAGLWRGGSQGEGAQTAAETNRCHDITVYPEIGLAAGACAGNGILLDIRDVVNPRRIDEVADPNFAFWHSATFDNAGTKLLYTDEWGGGTAPRCRATDRPEWGANAIFTLADRRELNFAGYFKLPAAQTAQENCVAHNGSLIPVPGRDIMVQAWYQGGVSVLDWTDPANPVEIAYFDRGPLDPTELITAGHWSAYWYNGHIFATEIMRGLDVFRLVPGEHLSQNEIDAAKTVRMEQFNPQLQQRLVIPPSFVVARAYLDQLTRGRGLAEAQLSRTARALDRAEGLRGAQRRTALTQLAAQLEREAGGAADASRVRALAGVVRELAQG
jgi:hypothetical protein